MLRVLTLNVWNLSGDWRSRRGAVLDVLRRCEPDVVVVSSRVFEEPRLSRADLPLLLPESPEVSSPAPVDSFDVASVLPVSSVLAVELALLLLSAFFLEQPATAIAETTTNAKAMI